MTRESYAEKLLMGQQLRGIVGPFVKIILGDSYKRKKMAK